jgi:hypothetical protein
MSGCLVQRSYVDCLTFWKLHTCRRIGHHFFKVVAETVNNAGGFLLLREALQPL